MPSPYAEMLIMKFQKCYLLLLAAVLLGGCSTLSKDQCLTGDWYDLGYQEGLTGRHYNKLSRHQKSCSKHGVQIDSGQYRTGYERGLEAFCDTFDHYQSGREGNPYKSQCRYEGHKRNHRDGIAYYCNHTDPYALGVKGGAYHKVCGAEFGARYTEGRVIFDLKRRISKLEREKNSLEKKAADAKSEHEAKTYRDRIKDVDRKIKVAKAEVLAEQIEHNHEIANKNTLRNVLDLVR